MTLQEAAPIIGGVGIMLTLIWNIYQATVGRQKADAAQDSRIAILETQMGTVRDAHRDTDRHSARLEVLEIKMGLFWHLVEDNMADLLAKANPIHLTADEQVSAHFYKYEKAKTATVHLKRLDQAITREIPNLSHDEVAAFTMIQSAIRAQLVDRHEYPYSG